jgi:hypothetical protein
MIHPRAANAPRHLNGAVEIKQALCLIATYAAVARAYPALRLPPRSPPQMSEPSSPRRKAPDAKRALPNTLRRAAWVSRSLTTANLWMRRDCAAALRVTFPSRHAILFSRSTLPDRSSGVGHFRGRLTLHFKCRRVFGLHFSAIVRYRLVRIRRCRRLNG